MRLLVVEDDSQLRQQLAQFFRQLGWAVDEAATGEEALYLGLEYPPDAAIVDLGLPGLSGLEVVRNWRQQACQFAVLILTARSDWQDKVAGLEAGADDYVTKPFHLEEVQARVNALLRRVAGRSLNRASYGPVEIDFSAREVRVHGGLVELTSFEYNTLEFLVHRAGGVVSKAELTDHLYQQDFDRDSNVIEVFIGRLRKKLDPQGQLRPIITVRGAGYRFALAPTPA